MSSDSIPERRSSNCISPDLIRVDVATEYYMWSTLDFDVPDLLTEVVKTTIRHLDLIEWCNGRFVAILLSEDSRLHHLNQTYRNEDKSTNILTFPYISSNEIPPHCNRNAKCTETTPDRYLEKLKEESCHETKTVANLPKSALDNSRGEDYIGDIFISYNRIEEECVMYGKSFKEHLTHMIIHGVLHVLGYDHNNDEGAIVMESIEAKIMEIYGYKNPYIAKNDI